jgi:hypothetical protein
VGVDALALGKAGLSVFRFFKEKHRQAAEDHHDACVLELAQVAEAMAVALVAAGTGQDPLSNAVQLILEDELGTPRFAARAHRLFKEMLSSPSKRRRKRLAAVLLGGPAAVKGPDELDRLDILVAQLLDGDVLLLNLLSQEMETTHLEPDGFDAQQFFVSDGGRLWCSRGNTAQEVLSGIDRVCLETLMASGCVRSRRKLQHLQGLAGKELQGMSGHIIELSPIGAFLLSTLAREPIASVLNEP